MEHRNAGERVTYTITVLDWADAIASLHPLPNDPQSRRPEGDGWVNWSALATLLASPSDRLDPERPHSGFPVVSYNMARFPSFAEDSRPDTATLQ